MNYDKLIICIFGICYETGKPYIALPLVKPGIDDGDLIDQVLESVSKETGFDKSWISPVIMKAFKNNGVINIVYGVFIPYDTKLKSLKWKAVEATESNEDYELINYVLEKLIMKD